MSSDEPRIDAEVVRTDAGATAKRRANAGQLAGARKGGRVTAVLRRTRKALGLTRYGNPPTPEETAAAERRRKADAVVDDARMHLRERSKAASELLDRALVNPVDPTQIAAAKSILAKAGIADLQAIEHRGEPPVVVNLGGMDLYPSPDADVDGVEPDEREDGSE